jgi:murein tripeptide amidase MpaA
LVEWLGSIAVEEKVAVRKIGLSLGGLDLYSLVINDRSKKEKDIRATKDLQESSSGRVAREAVIVMARTHPGETVSNWALESFVTKVLDTPVLTDHYVFFILPMVNPDGVFLGNHRTGVLGQDLNRNFQHCDLEFFPEI